MQLSEDLEIPAMSVYIFGSRRHSTGSIRSDIDLLLISHRRLTPEDAQRIWDSEPYLDIFQVIGGIADSLINESRLEADSREALIELVDAIPLFVDGDWQAGAELYDNQQVLGERAPAATVVPLYDLYDAVPAERADILVVTALTEEYEAVLKVFSHRESTTSIPSDAGTQHTSRMNVDGWLITFRNLAEMGSVGAALKTRDAMLRTKAQHVVLVGICAGIPGKVALGDVVVPKSVLYFESAKMSTKGEEQADDQRQCDDNVRVVASLIAAKLTAKKIELRAGDGVMACGEKVVASKRFRKRIQKRHRKIIAIDMESYGVARAAGEVGRRVTVIKGVCDLADKKKNDKWHRIAARNAAETLLALIRDDAFKAG
jgi:nucleoside phosphorylase